MREDARSLLARLPPAIVVLGAMLTSAVAWGTPARRPAADPGHNPLRDVLRFLGTPEPGARHRVARAAARQDRPMRLAAHRPRIVVPADLDEDDAVSWRPYGGYRVVIYPGPPYGSPYGQPYPFRPYGDRPYAGPAYGYVPYGARPYGYPFDGPAGR